MKKITKTQIITIIALILCVIWEIYLSSWSKTQVGAIIRVDIFIIYPVLLVLIIISVYQLLKKNK